MKKDQLRIVQDPTLKADEIEIRVNLPQADEAFIYDILQSVLAQSPKTISGDVQGRLVVVLLTEVLFLETEGEYVRVHTATMSMVIRQRLYQLAAELPPSFVRVSKSCLVQSTQVSGIDRNLTSSSLIHFRDSYKTVYASRRYVRQLIDLIETERGLLR